MGSSANLTGNIDVNGSIVIGGGTVSGIVTHPSGTNYSGPNIGTRNRIGVPAIPTLPSLPTPATIPVFQQGSPFNFSTTQTVFPGFSYGDITLNGNKTLTFSGPGVYVFNSIKNSGTANNFVFDFKGLSGTIKIYVSGNVDLNKINASIIGGGDASRVYLETQGKGTASNPVAFNIANGSAGNSSKWVGTVYAPYAAINIGSGTGSSNITGALWSGTQVNIQSGVEIMFAPFIFCTPPTANAGPDQNKCVLTVVKLAANCSGAAQQVNGQ